MKTVPTSLNIFYWHSKYKKRLIGLDAFSFVELTCLTIRRDRMFMTNPPSRGYMVRDWMTVRMSSIGRGFCSISCCITTARTSEVYTFLSAKHRLVAGAEIHRKNQTGKVHKSKSVWFLCTQLAQMSGKRRRILSGTRTWLKVCIKTVKDVIYKVPKIPREPLVKTWRSKEKWLSQRECLIAS